MREAVGQDFIVMYRLSMLDLVAGGSDWSEVETLAQHVERAGATMINTGLGGMKRASRPLRRWCPGAVFSL